MFCRSRVGAQGDGDDSSLNVGSVPKAVGGTQTKRSFDATVEVRKLTSATAGLFLPTIRLLCSVTRDSETETAFP